MPHENTPRPRRPVGAVKISGTNTSGQRPGASCAKTGVQTGY
nr:MAG TPA: hypothetical protein [Caudoviricetes sp.]